METICLSGISLTKTAIALVKSFTKYALRKKPNQTKPKVKQSTTWAQMKTRKWVWPRMLISHVTGVSSFPPLFSIYQRRHISADVAGSQISEKSHVFSLDDLSPSSVAHTLGLFAPKALSSHTHTWLSQRMVLVFHSMAITISLEQARKHTRGPLTPRSID